ncbi:hypothetical protein HWV62_18148 [Athelia sp. TMB]|nr:hypothetical protein HWV62_18148 [Athelia sp. TMB]
MAWVPLESNPEIFNGWANSAGLEPDSGQFYDVLGLDEELLALVPRPVKAVIMVSPYHEGLPRWQAENEAAEKPGAVKVDGSIFWMKQTIRNACGAMALMHAVANTDVRFTPSSPLETFFASPACQAPSTPNNGNTRAEVFSSTPVFAEIHASMCNAGQSAPASADEHPDGAYVCFVKHDGRLIELDGGRPGAIDRGPCNDLLEVRLAIE